MSLDTAAVLALAPDDSSAKAARGLMAPGQWSHLGASEAAVWGECKGSGSKPYQTQVDLAGPAFRCSCPSRKFPCKHGLALLLLRAQQPALFPADPAPAWVNDWLASRTDKAEKKERKEEQKRKTIEAEAADPQAAERRLAQRWARVEGAAAELQRWLADQVRRGLGQLGPEAVPAWQAMAARMVDAQAPGLGLRLREAAGLLGSGERGPERLLHQLGLLHLACEALQRRASLASADQAELRALAGWPFDRAEVLALGEHLQDHWMVVGQMAEARDERLTERRVWLLGQATGRRHLLLDHAHGDRGFEQSWPTGSVHALTLACFPGAGTLRVLVAETAAPGATPTGARPPCRSLADEWQAMAQRMAVTPWAPWHPLLLSDASLSVQEGRGWVHAGGCALPWRAGEAETWSLLAFTGGQPVSLMGEWDGQKLRVLSAWGAEGLWLGGVA